MCLVGFASIAIVVVCGRCVLHRLFATTCKHPCLKPLGVQLRASMPASKKCEVLLLGQAEPTMMGIEVYSTTVLKLFSVTVYFQSV